LYSLLDLSNRINTKTAIKFQSDILMTDGHVIIIENDFYIRATARGGAWSTKLISTTIIVCGSEVISNAVAGPFVKTQVIAPADVDTEYTNSEWFSSTDDYCPTIIYSLRATN
jgi:hypothetical protein